MRVVFGVLSLLVAVAIVGILAKKQLTSVSAPPAASGIAPAATPQQQVQQFQQAVQGTLQQARPMPEDK
jgi:Na+-transporting methylmalonyl-CoA/oxaloacetate decarboxylase gamma subunit